MISPEEALGSRDLTSTTMADLPIDDLNVSSNETLITPAQLKREIPLTEAAQRTVAHGRQVVRDILDGKDHRLFVVVGPCSIHDIKAAHEYAERLKVLAARTMLLAGVSHDLRTPLARMRLTLELLRTQPSDALLDRLERDMIHMNQLIANVLDLARGVTQEPLARLDVATLLGALAREHARPDRPVPVRAVADSRMTADGGLTTTDWPADGCQAMLPALSLRRALGNLLENAMRHGSAGPVELVCVRCAPGHGGLQLGVLDRGAGIPPDRMEAVFQPFLRLEPSRSPTTGGSGLGLAIVRQLADAHGWTVQLQPRPGGGLAAWLHIHGCMHLSQN